VACGRVPWELALFDTHISYLNSQFKPAALDASVIGLKLCYDGKIVWSYGDLYTPMQLRSRGKRAPRTLGYPTVHCCWRSRPLQAQPEHAAQVQRPRPTSSGGKTLERGPSAHTLRHVTSAKLSISHFLLIQLI
jgi:hypothetical protein